MLAQTTCLECGSKHTFYDWCLFYCYDCDTYQEVRTDIHVLTKEEELRRLNGDNWLGKPLKKVGRILSAEEKFREIFTTQVGWKHASPNLKHVLTLLAQSSHMVFEEKKAVAEHLENMDDVDISLLMDRLLREHDSRKSHFQAQKLKPQPHSCSFILLRGM